MDTSEWVVLNYMVYEVTYESQDVRGLCQTLVLPTLASWRKACKACRRASISAISGSCPFALHEMRGCLPMLPPP